MNPILKKIWNFASWLLVAAVVILAILLAGVRLVGFTPYTVLSGSMEPAYPVGSLIYVRSAAPEDISAGDAITLADQSARHIPCHLRRSDSAASDFSP